MSLLRNRLLFALSLGHFVIDLFCNFPPMMFPIMVSTLGLTYGQIGLAAMVFAGTSSTLQPLFGHLDDRYRSRWLQAFGVAWIVVIMGFAGFAWDYLSLLLFLGLAGIGSASFHPQAATKIADADIPNKSTALSIFSLGGNAGYALGPIVAAAFIGWFGLGGGSLLVVPGLLAAAFIGFSLRQMEQQKRRKVSRPRPLSTPKVAIPVFAVSILLLVTILRSWLQNALVLYVPLLFSYDLALASQMLFVLLVGSAVGGVAGGITADRFGGRLLVISSLILSAPAVYLFLNSSDLTALAAAFAVGALMGSSYPVTVVMAQEYMPENVGVASGLMMGFAWGVGGLGIYAIGLAADSVGLAAALSILIFVPLAAGVLSFLLPRALPASRLLERASVEG